jgi:hypothetical protein
MITQVRVMCLNGGASGQEEFRDMTLDRLVQENKNMEATLIARSSMVRLRDYEGALQ